MLNPDLISPDFSWRMEHILLVVTTLAVFFAIERLFLSHLSEKHYRRQRIIAPLVIFVSAVIWYSARELNVVSQIASPEEIKAALEISAEQFPEQDFNEFAASLPQLLKLAVYSGYAFAIALTVLYVFYLNYLVHREPSKEEK